MTKIPYKDISSEEGYVLYYDGEGNLWRRQKRTFNWEIGPQYIFHKKMGDDFMYIGKTKVKYRTIKRSHEEVSVVA